MTMISGEYRCSRFVRPNAEPAGFHGQQVERLRIAPARRIDNVDGRWTSHRREPSAESIRRKALVAAVARRPSAVPRCHGFETADCAAERQRSPSLGDRQYDRFSAASRRRPCRMRPSEIDAAARIPVDTVTNTWMPHRGQRRSATHQGAGPALAIVFPALPGSLKRSLTIFNNGTSCQPVRVGGAMTTPDKGSSGPGAPDADADRVDALGFGRWISTASASICWDDGIGAFRRPRRHRQE